jgi:hypothetical protein
MTTQLYNFPSASCADGFLKDLKKKGFKVRESAMSADPDSDGVLLAVRVDF